MSDTQIIKVGMLGAGFILKAHATAVAAIEGLRLHVVSDASLGRAQAAAATFGFAQAVGSIEEMAGSDCDVVHILLPPALHIEAARTLVEAGKSVFIEKPMGLDSAGCAALCELARARGVTIGVNHNFLFGPQYEQLRREVKAGAFGRIDQLSINWHYELPLLHSGPFDNWMLAAPANVLFELGPHVAAFALDLMDPTRLLAAVASNPRTIPGNRQVFRHWSALGEAAGARVALSLSLTPGQADRYLRLRGRGGSAQLDFGRDFRWRELTLTDNPVFDAHLVPAGIGRETSATARTERRRRILAAVRKRPDSEPFAESIFRSIRAFYEGGIAKVDPRHDGGFATQVIRLCEQIADAAGAGSPSLGVPPVTMPAPLSKPNVLVVGGTGFIGRRLVRKLVDRGLGVRVLTRNLRGAALDLEGLPVELVQGSHGDPATLPGALDGIEVVYHLAKCEGRRWQDYVEGDIEPTRALAKAALERGVRRFIYTGTIDSYASASPAARIDSTTPLDPRIGSRNLYARSKAACEALLEDLHRTRGLPLVILRPGIVIGPGSPPAHLGVGRFTSDTQIDFWGDGRSKLPLVLADDVADALALAFDAPAIEGQAFLLTSEPLLSAEEYVQALSAHAGIRIEARPRPAWRYWLADLVKEGVKNVIRHPNRRRPSLHDWRCRSHRARYDSSDARARLGWSPVADKDVMIRRGIHASVDSLA